MMQLLCNGTFLDLYEGSGLQFTHKNPLFAFDALECERTTSFKIPATPKNDRVLALAKLPALSGVAMRRKYDAELYDGTVVKKGYIYVSNFDGKDYNAIFVTGELVGLQALKNAGKIRDLLVFDQAVTWDNTTTHTADEATLPDIGFVQYEREPSAAHLNASISLRWLMGQIATKTGVTINYLNAASDERWRLLTAGADIYNLNDLAVHLVQRGVHTIFLQGLLGITIWYSAGAYIADCVAVRDDQYLRWAALQPTLQQFEMLKFAYEIALEFPEDFPDDYFIMSNGYWSMSGATWYNEEICNMYRPISDEYYVFGPYGRCANFLGGYTFDWEGNAHGAPLAGRKVTIPANTPFALLPKSALVYREPEAVGDTATIGYDTSAVPAYDYEVRISINHDFVYGEDVPLNAMLPEFTAVELLKLYAAINGCVLNYTDAQGVTFEPLDFDNYAMRDIKALTKRGELVRTFSDYAQRNIVKMTPEDWVWLGERIKTQYAIDNDNIEAEKDLLVLKASEGGKKIAYTNTGDVHTRLLVRNDAEGKRKAKDQTIALASVDDPYMLRVTIPTIDGLQNLCTASTQQKISARMTLLEYNAIQAKTLALVEGLRYIWTERSWQKNEAQFTLARLYEASAAPIPQESYTFVEWIKPIGQSPTEYDWAYINTGVPNGDNVGCELFIKFASNSDSVYGSLEVNKRFGFAKYGNMLYLFLNNAYYPGYIAGIIGNTQYKIRFNYMANNLVERYSAGGYLEASDSIPSHAPAGNYDVILFGCSQDWSGSFGVYTKDTENITLYGAKITVGSQTVRDLRPCRRDSDGELGMLDVINNVFYSNEGGGSFEVGPDVN